MTEEQIKNWAREKANTLEENQTLGIYDRDEDMRYDEGYNDGQVSGYEKGLIDGYHEGFKDCAKSRLNVTTISDCPNKHEVQLEYARTIIKDLLFNSDEYARQRAIDFLINWEQRYSDGLY